jgi:RNA polymerase sigma factor (sigma-70 family)
MHLTTPEMVQNDMPGGPETKIRSDRAKSWPLVATKMSGSSLWCVYALITRTAMSPDAQKPEAQARFSESQARERLTEVCKRDYHKLVQFVRRRLSRDKADQRDEAEEIVARSLFNVLLKGPLQSVASLSAYWLTAVRNELRNDYRHADMRRRTEPALAYEHQPSPSPESLCLEQELEEERARVRDTVLREAIDALSARRRMAFRLKVWEGLSTREVVARFAAEGIEISGRQVLRYVDDGWEACRRALQAHEDKKEGIK